MSVVTDGFDRKRSSEWTVRISGLQLNDCFCSPHQARHCTFILQKLFFLFLGNKSEGSEANGLCSLFSQGCAQMQLFPRKVFPHGPSEPSAPLRLLAPCAVWLFSFVLHIYHYLTDCICCYFTDLSCSLHPTPGRVLVWFLVLAGSWFRPSTKSSV